MAGSKVNDYGIADVNFTALMESVDAQRIGYFALSFTEYGTVNKPAIAAGSKVEVNGGLYKFDIEEAISQSPADGEIYVMLKPSGDTITAEFTATAPVWSDSKQGYYGEGGNANYRYVGSMILDTAEYRNKLVYYTGREKTVMDLQTLSELHTNLLLAQAATHDVIFTYEWDVEAIVNLTFNVVGTTSYAWEYLLISAIDTTDEVITVTVKNIGLQANYDFFVSCTASKKRV